MFMPNPGACVDTWLTPTYAIWWIRQALRRALGNQSRAIRIRTWARTSEPLRAYLGTTPGRPCASGNEIRDRSDNGHQRWRLRTRRTARRSADAATLHLWAPPPLMARVEGGYARPAGPHEPDRLDRDRPQRQQDPRTPQRAINTPEAVIATWVRRVIASGRRH
jgi:hypothetical protein